MTTSLRAAVREATSRLAAAGVPSPEVDAVALAAYVLSQGPGEVHRGMVLGARLSETQASRYADLLSHRAARVPLQHLTGRAGFRRLELGVGPGTFVPRPETELAVELVLAELDRVGAASSGASVVPVVPVVPVVVDLCTGSGAIALAVKDERPHARVLAVELSDLAYRRAQHNARSLDLDVTVILGDATADPRAGVDLPGLTEVVGRAAVVVSNPPYVPTDAVPRDPEVRDHDPALALYGGSQDGLAIPLAIARTAATLLRPGGLLVMEHADTQGETLPAGLRAEGWDEVHDHHDLAGRPRTTTARRAP
ncbi:peptide chain release factor N(5)-glutamine methyltransferase [Arsenicicoccus sp. oral taxon 190]|uniref:peptide chain release factor N(5)-glutamine methyltransferase n=1 Tax=Arsenicicoccus sp. oral taxon 190 TaxID=1658671 RepID=UPI000679FE7C|nr:peptide chain release factor N(5)-glutamine methyltransferase [Arsenicicoccus sp. oral taxon 190]AKT52374.1 SAM-dependent methyltransferase [Arsenicicoccus sp. oral taxon 190]